MFLLWIGLFLVVVAILSALCDGPKPVVAVCLRCHGRFERTFRTKAEAEEQLRRHQEQCVYMEKL